MYRKVTIMGRLGKNAEVKHVADRDRYVLSIAVNERIKGEDSTIWVRVLYVKTNDRLRELLLKGTVVMAYGRPEEEIYVDKAGNTVINRTVWASDLQVASFPDKSVGANNSLEPQSDDLPF